PPSQAATASREAKTWRSNARSASMRAAATSQPVRRRYAVAPAFARNASLLPEGSADIRSDSCAWGIWAFMHETSGHTLARVALLPGLRPRHQDIRGIAGSGRLGLRVLQGLAGRIE